MPWNFVSPDREQRFLLPPDMRDWLPEDDLAWLVLDAVERIDLDAFRRAYRDDGQGRAAFDPAMMVGLLLYAYCHGVRSSRQVERRCVRDVAFRVICGGLVPDHATVARFRSRHAKALEMVFTEVLRLCAEAGMVDLAVLAIDGTKVAADASWSANRTLEQIEAELAKTQPSGGSGGGSRARPGSGGGVLRAASAAMIAEAEAVDAAEDARFGAARGDELPEQLRTRGGRAKRLRQARDRLAAEQAARYQAQVDKQAAWQRRKDQGRRPGRKPHPPGEATSGNGKPLRANLTDPEARTMKTKHTLLVGYNAQAVATVGNQVNAGQVIVGATVTNAEVDINQLHPTLDVTRSQLRAAGITPRLATVVCDSGYATEAAFAQAHTDKIRLLAPLAKDTRELRDGGDPAGGANLANRPETARGQRRLRHWAGRRDYAQRGRTIEPVFGQVKTRQDMTRFTRRGLTAAQSEWHLACAAHNLHKLHKHTR